MTSAWPTCCFNSDIMTTGTLLRPMTNSFGQLKSFRLSSPRARVCVPLCQNARSGGILPHQSPYSASIRRSLTKSTTMVQSFSTPQLAPRLLLRNNSRPMFSPLNRFSRPLSTSTIHRWRSSCCENALGSAKFATLRVVPTSPTAGDAAVFDSMMERCARTLARAGLDTEVFRELQLPVKPLDAKKPSLGIGLTSAKNIAAAAFLVSSSAANRLHNTVLSDPIRNFPTYNKALDAQRTWSLSCLQSNVFPF